MADARSAIHDRRDKPNQAGSHSKADVLSRVSATSLKATASTASHQATPVTTTTTPTMTMSIAAKPAGSASEEEGQVGRLGKKRVSHSASKTHSDSPQRGE